MTKSENTRAFIIEKTASLFNTKGYAGTSLSDITKATGLTKGSIYGNFDNKDGLAIAVYDHQVKALGAKKKVVLPTTSAIEQLRGQLQFYRDNWTTMFKLGGCPIFNAAVEADDSLPFLKKKVQSSIKDWANSIAVVIEEGITNKEFNKKTDPLMYAYHFIALIEGGIMLSKIMNDQQHLLGALDRIDTIITGELKK